MTKLAGGFATGPALATRPGVPCVRCGAEVNIAGTRGSVVTARCTRCFSETQPQATPRARRLLRARVSRKGLRKAKAYAVRDRNRGDQLAPRAKAAFARRADQQRSARIEAARRALRAAA